jgi:hypothetical protein
MKNHKRVDRHAQFFGLQLTINAFHHLQRRGSGELMKRFFGLVLILASLSLNAFAAGNSKTISFSKAVKVGSTQVAPGEYKVSWTGNDADVQVAITQNGKAIVTVPAKVEPAKNGYVSLGTRTVNGTNVLESIQLEKLNLVLKNASASGE